MLRGLGRCPLILVTVLCLALIPRQAAARPADSFASSYYRIIINVPAKTLEVYAEGQLIRHCPCAVGRPWTPSPYGVYHIINKTVDPTWYNPRGSPVPPGPSNPLGPRWLGVSKPGYGIHGTNVETSVGTAASHGCVRLSREDILWLYDTVPLGTRVQYVYQPAVVSGDPLTGFAVIEIAPDIYERGALTPESLQALAADWGGNLPVGTCADLIAASSVALHSVVDLNPSIVCAGRQYSLNLELADRTVLVPVAPFARALADAGASIDAADLASDGFVPAAELDERLGLPIAISPSGPQQALVSPVVVRLDGRTLPIPGRLEDGEPLVHLPALLGFIAPGGPLAVRDMLSIVPSEEAAARPGPVDRRVRTRTLPDATYVSWREIGRLFSPTLTVRRCGPCLNLFLGRD